MANIYSEEFILNKLRKVLPDLIKLEHFDKKDFYSKSKDVHIEIKCRSKHWSTLGIQKDKWDYLTQFKKARFIVATPQGMWSWDLNKVSEPIWEKRVGPTSTYYKHLSIVDECWKDIGYLDIKDAKDISYLLKD
jgi:hypothetical protein